VRVDGCRLQYSRERIAIFSLIEDSEIACSRGEEKKGGGRWERKRSNGHGCGMESDIHG
jgi:hypothetical protein